jgi:hypothetical protein
MFFGSGFANTAAAANRQRAQYNQNNNTQQNNYAFTQSVS